MSLSAGEGLQEATATSDSRAGSADTTPADTTPGEAAPGEPARGEPARAVPLSPMPPRRHTGRRRNAAARDAILDATFELLRTQGAHGVTIDAIAAAAGVGRQTIYRWWPTKGAVAAEAMARGARMVVPDRDTGSFTEDLERFLTDSFAGLEDPGYQRALRQLVSAAQQDEHVAEVLAEFTAHRRAALRALLERGRASGEISATTDLGMLVDMAYGVLWYRLLVGHAPLDAGAARSLAAHLIAAAQDGPAVQTGKAGQA
jgi:AcrR family transcriptional regulator